VNFDAKYFIREIKFGLLRRFDLTEAFAKSRDMMPYEVETIRAEHDPGVTVIPQVEYHKIAQGSVEEPFSNLVQDTFTKRILVYSERKKLIEPSPVSPN